MADLFKTDLFLEKLDYFGNVPTPINVTFYSNYAPISSTLTLDNYFGNLNLGYYSGSTLGDIFSYTMQEFQYDKEYQGISFDVIVYNYFLMLPLNLYSGSTVAEVSAETITELGIETYV